jgi:NAD(P)-dependent dehydrogenase (short-subunit alcohol dehydrogenase family)
MKDKISDSVVVITGASSGIGRATALKFAREGATVVLAARREDALKEVAEQCEAHGGRALAIPTDVSDSSQVQALATQAMERLGRIDVWVNNAAVSMFGRFEEVPDDAFRRVIETNFFGYVYGARAVLPLFREQGHGTLINVSSVVGTFGQPYTSAYVASKWAIRGLSETLRMEVALDQAKNINVCTVLPASIDTPLFQNAANFTGRAPRAMDPVYDAEKVASAIFDLVQHPKREVYVGSFGRAAAFQHLIARGLTEEMIARAVDQNHFQDRPADPSMGNLFEPLPQYASVSGEWKVTTPVAKRRFALPVAAVAASLIGWRMLRDGDDEARDSRNRKSRQKRDRRKNGARIPLVSRLMPGR